MVRRRAVRGPNPKPERKDFNADRTKAPKTSISSSYQKSKLNQALERPGKQSQGALDLYQPSTVRDGPRLCSLSNCTRGGRLPVSPRTDLQAIPTPGLDKEVITNQLWQPISASLSNDHDALCDLIASKFDEVLSSIDGETFVGKEEDLCISFLWFCFNVAHRLRAIVIQKESGVGLRGGWGSRQRAVMSGADGVLASAVLSINYFAKAKLYANSRLPTNLPSLHLYIPAWPLVCLAAQYSWRAYDKPTGAEREAFVSADWRMGTKAMMIKSVPIDDMNCVVFAIRGSQTFLDWVVNLNSAPVSPRDFLDDPGNLCHQGFLSVARKMIKPVAARLRCLLEENPWRSSCSLLMTGHSAGGAVASLLYAHMLAENVRSEINTLTGCFKRIHCLTFGTPPISLLPLTKPTALRHKKSMFMSFINEGDPVPRADKAYVRSLLSLYASPAPGLGPNCLPETVSVPKPRNLPKPRKAVNKAMAVPAPQTWMYKWNIPPGTLSNAGRLVVLQELNSEKTEAVDDVKAVITCDQQLREVVFGDPIMHMMSVYARRVEVLATKAVTLKVRG